MNFKTLIILFVAIGSLKIVQAQSTLCPFYGKTFDKKNGVIAARAGIRLNNLYKNRIGFYYLYEFQDAVMPFVNTTVTGNYRRDILGITCKIHPNFTVNVGVGMFIDGLLKDQLQSKGENIPWIIKPVGLRKEVGITYQPNDFPIQFSLGYSLSIGFTANLGWSIPLSANTLTVHQAITAD